MNICILGWYGTETLGDRAILDGIIYIFTAIESNIRISIGSLYPIVTERTIFEDINIYRSHTGFIDVTIFDVKNKKDLHEAIEQAHFVIMGGGPLMDLIELYIIQHAFKYAKKLGKTTALMGCGYGPLKKKEYIRCVRNIIHSSDLIVMRSESCKENILSLCDKDDIHKVFSSIDPAAISVIEYLRRFYPLKIDNRKSKHNSGWLMNIRDLDYVYNTQDYYYPRIRLIVNSIASQVPQLYLFPMHTFSIGGDDRYIENRIAQDLKLENISVVQKPLSLQDAYDAIYYADGCIGMRYHSILFQTYLNGNNYIIDYTDSREGKIKRFLDTIDTNHFYENRYVNILDENEIFSNLNIIKTQDRYSFDESYEQSSLLLYKNVIEMAGKRSL